jgi:hypothetical protein
MNDVLPMAEQSDISSQHRSQSHAVLRVCRCSLKSQFNHPNILRRLTKRFPLFLIRSFKAKKKSKKRKAPKPDPEVAPGVREPVVWKQADKAAAKAEKAWIKKKRSATQRNAMAPVTEILYSKDKKRPSTRRDW